MEQLLNNETVIAGLTFLAGLLTPFLVKGIRSLAQSFKASSNKADDVLIEPLEDIADALDKSKDA